MGSQAKMKMGELAQAGTMYLLELLKRGTFITSDTWGILTLCYKAIILPEKWVDQKKYMQFFQIVKLSSPMRKMLDKCKMVVSWPIVAKNCPTTPKNQALVAVASQCGIGGGSGRTSMSTKPA